MARNFVAAQGDGEANSEPGIAIYGAGFGFLGGIRMARPSAADEYTHTQQHADVSSDPVEMGGPSAAA